jgi:hypothetical protein
VIVQLTAQELILAAHYAGLIEGVKSVQVKAHSASNKRISSMGDFAIQYAGMLGEVAVARVIGADVQHAITRGGDGKSDLDVNGRTIQVKTSTHTKTGEERRLIFNNESDFATEWAVSCSIQSASTVEIHGFISKSRFLKRMFIDDFGYGDRSCVVESDLTPIERFQEALKATAP